MKIKFLILFGVLCLEGFKISAQNTKTEVFKTNSSISISSSETVELIAAEGKYTSVGTFGSSSTQIFRGPRLKIAKDGVEFNYSVAPIGMEGWEGLFAGLSVGSYSSSAFMESWVFSGDTSGLVLEGPAILSYSTNNSNTEPFLLTYKKYSSVSSNSISSTSVVIPSSATGDVDIKLEQSQDNVTWTECLPGTYNSSTVKRFFRLRAVEK